MESIERFSHLFRYVGGPKGACQYDYGDGLGVQPILSIFGLLTFEHGLAIVESFPLASQALASVFKIL